MDIPDKLPAVTSAPALVGMDTEVPKSSEQVVVESAASTCALVVCAAPATMPNPSPNKRHSKKKNVYIDQGKYASVKPRSQFQNFGFSFLNKYCRKRVLTTISKLQTKRSRKIKTGNTISSTSNKNDPKVHKAKQICQPDPQRHQIVCETAGDAAESEEISVADCTEKPVDIVTIELDSSDDYDDGAPCNRSMDQESACLSKDSMDDRRKTHQLAHVKASKTRLNLNKAYEQLENIKLSSESPVPVSDDPNIPVENVSHPGTFQKSCHFPSLNFEPHKISAAHRAKKSAGTRQSYDCFLCKAEFSKETLYFAHMKSQFHLDKVLGKYIRGSGKVISEICSVSSGKSQESDSCSEECEVDRLQAKFSDRKEIQESSRQVDTDSMDSGKKRSSGRRRKESSSIAYNDSDRKWSRKSLAASDTTERLQSDECATHDTFCRYCENMETCHAYLYVNRLMHLEFIKGSKLFCSDCQFLYGSSKTYEVHLQSTRHQESINNRIEWKGRREEHKIQQDSARFMSEFVTLDAVGIFEEEKMDRFQFGTEDKEVIKEVCGQIVLDDISDDELLITSDQEESKGPRVELEEVSDIEEDSYFHDDGYSQNWVTEADFVSDDDFQVDIWCDKDKDSNNGV